MTIAKTEQTAYIVTEAGKYISEADQSSPYQCELSRVFDSRHKRVDENTSAPGQSCSKGTNKSYESFVLEFLRWEEDFALNFDWIQIVRKENAICLIHADGNEDIEEGTHQDAELASARH